MEEKNKTYTAADFARYHAGTMPPGDMHALEKAALEDPFLGDALEGYLHSPDVKDDIEDLKLRMAEKRKRRNVFFISSMAQNKWWRIAALFIIIAGSGYLFYQLNFVKKENSLAESKMKGVAQKTDSIVALKSQIEKTTADSIPKNNDVAFENATASKVPKPTGTLPQATKSSAKKKTVFPEQKIESLSVAGYEKESTNDLNSDSLYTKQDNKGQDTLAANEYVLKGMVTDDMGAPVPFATITDKDRKKGTVADGSGHFFLRSKDSSITAIATAPGFDTKTFPLKKDGPPAIAMNKSKTELSEVVVTGLGVRKRKRVQASASKELEGKVAGVSIKTNGPQPLGGLEKFNSYLKENASPVYDDNNERLTGEVLLSFTLNKKGRPKNIKVLKSSCEACEEEAIKLLEDGPGWIGGKDTVGTVMIPF